MRLNPSDIGISDTLSLEDPDLGGTRVYALPKWSSYGDPQKLEIMRKLAEARATQDPSIAVTATSIFKKAGVEPRDHVGQAAALLYFIQRGVYYVHEKGERLQDPRFTLIHRLGDCDDQVLALAALCSSVRLENKFVVAGLDQAGQMRYWVEGEGPCPSDVDFSHIFLVIGTPTFHPTHWWWAEPTLRVPLGWSVMTHDSSDLPELQDRPRLASMSADLGSAPEASASQQPDLSVRHVLRKMTGREPHWTVQLALTAAVSAGSVIAATVLAEVAMSHLRPTLVEKGWLIESKS